MPLNRSAGFIYLGDQKTEEVPHTIAHELGHGAFGLEHVGVAANGSPTDNLMDYSQGTALDKPQWDAIHSSYRRLAWFQGAEEGRKVDRVLTDLNEFYNLHNQHLGIGLQPNGKIITKIRLKSKGQIAIPSVSAALPYVVSGISVFEGAEKVREYSFDAQSGRYVSSRGDFEGEITTADRGSVAIYTIFNDCYYEKNAIDWTYVPGEDVQAELKRHAKKGRPILFYYYDASPSCFDLYSKAISESSEHKGCTDVNIVNRERQEVEGVFQHGTTRELVAVVNSSCNTSLSVLSYEQQLAIFEKIAGQERIGLSSELALVRLMENLHSSSYLRFIQYLSQSDDAPHAANRVFGRLIGELTDQLPFDKDLYTRFMRQLLRMYNKLHTQVDLLQKATTTMDLLMAFNLDKEKVSSISTLSGVQSYYKQTQGSYNSSGRFITVTERYDVLAPTPRGVMPGALSNSVLVDKINPLAPVLVYLEPEVDLVKVAVEGNTFEGSSLLAPAFFLEYVRKKAANDHLETAAVVALDLIIVYTSGPVAITAKLNSWRKYYAYFELVGAAGNLAVTTIDTKDESVRGAIDAYNGLVAVLGVKNLAKGAYGFTKGLAPNVRNAIGDPEKIRNLALQGFNSFKLSNIV